MSLITYEEKEKLLEKAKTDKAGKSFILSVKALIPKDDQDQEDLERLGYNTLTEFIRSSKGLVLDAETFVKLAFAFWVYRYKACETIKYLATVEGWTELLDHVNDEYKAECGARLNAPNTGIVSDNVTHSERGNSKSYTLLRLARDAEHSKEVAEAYESVKKGDISPNKAAIDLGWRDKTITIRKDAESAARSLKKLFSNDEIGQLIGYLNE